nr:probable linoleate 9S-lipoxygenase 5 [Tanacetum cinerariifolium]
MSKYLFEEFPDSYTQPKLYEDEFKLPKSSSKIKKNINLELLKELLRSDGEKPLTFPTPNIIKGLFLAAGDLPRYNDIGDYSGYGRVDSAKLKFEVTEKVCGLRFEGGDGLKRDSQVQEAFGVLLTPRFLDESE